MERCVAASCQRTGTRPLSQHLIGLNSALLRSRQVVAHGRHLDHGSAGMRGKQPSSIPCARPTRESMPWPPERFQVRGCSARRAPGHQIPARPHAHPPLAPVASNHDLLCRPQRVDRIRDLVIHDEFIAGKEAGNEPVHGKKDARAGDFRPEETGCGFRWRAHQAHRACQPSRLEFQVRVACLPDRSTDAVQWVGDQHTRSVLLGAQLGQGRAWRDVRSENVQAGTQAFEISGRVRVHGFSVRTSRRNRKGHLSCDLSCSRQA
jgi:hypothetical protein